MGDGAGFEPSGGDPVRLAEAPATAPDGETFVDTTLITAVPLHIAVEKLRGFVVDHHAEILSIKADRVELQIEAKQRRSRRRSDRPVPFVVDLTFAEQNVPLKSGSGRHAAHTLHTRVEVTIRLKQTRDRRNSDVAPQATMILAALQSYLMAVKETQAAEPARSVNMFVPWMKMRS